jgi:hypothetical protein
MFCSLNLAMAVLMFLASNYGAAHNYDKRFTLVVLVAYFWAMTLLSVRYLIVMRLLDYRAFLTTSIVSSIIYFLVCLGVMRRRPESH